MLHHLLVSLLVLAPALAPPISAAVPETLNTISNAVLPNLNGSISSDSPRISVQIDATHTIYFTQYRRLVPARNYFAAIITMQTSMIVDYFERREETLEIGSIDLDVYGVHIFLDNPTGHLTYALAHRMLGALGVFLMERGYCTARFGLWEDEGAEVRQLSDGLIVPDHM